MSGVDILFLSALGLLLTLIGAGRGMEEYQKQIHEKLMAKNREILDDIDKLLDDIKNL